MKTKWKSFIEFSVALSLCKILLMLMLPQCSYKANATVQSKHMHAREYPSTNQPVPHTHVHTHLRQIRIYKCVSKWGSGCVRVRAPWMRMISTWDSNIYIGDWEDNKIMWDQHINDPSTSVEAAPAAHSRTHTHSTSNQMTTNNFHFVPFFLLLSSLSLYQSASCSLFAELLLCKKESHAWCLRFFLLLRK